MTIYIALEKVKKARKALAAYSTRAAAAAHMEGMKPEESAIDLFNLPPGYREAGSVFAAQQRLDGGAYELVGYFTSRFEAEAALRREGYVQELIIDEHIKKEEEAEQAKEESPEPEQQEETKAAPELQDPVVTRHQRPGISPAARDLLIKVAIFVFIIGGLAAFNILIFGESRDWAEHVKKVDWLPPAASDISYYKSDVFLICEFDMSEEDFVQWAKTERLALKPIRDKPISVPRYAGYLPPDAREKKDEEELDDENAPGLLSPENKAVVEHGIYFEQPLVMGKGKVQGAWNRETGRAYYHKTEF